MGPVRLNSSNEELFRFARSSSGTKAPERTGRYIVTYRDEVAGDIHKTFSNRAGFAVASAADFANQLVNFESLPEHGALTFPMLNIAIVSAPPDQIQAFSTESIEESGILSMEPEYFVYALDSAYVKGFRDGVNSLADHLVTGAPELGPAMVEAVPAAATWGLTVTGVTQSSKSGEGIKVAILDTGMDLNHPDFQGRPIMSQSFIEGQDVQDGNSHGTHCTGTSCGLAMPPSPPRYGIASAASIHIGKVLSNLGGGTDSSILAGINWAVTNGCHVISMSLGRRVQPNETPQTVYEQAGRRALQAGCLIVAAAGNDSQRPAIIQPVGSPANASTIMAVASVGENLRVSFFSNGGVNSAGGDVNIAGPGENVYSTVPMPRRYGLKSGTSMATPHVAGIAALHAQSDPNLRGQRLWDRLVATAKHLPDPKRDVGAGLVAAP